MVAVEEPGRKLNSGPAYVRTQIHTDGPSDNDPEVVFGRPVNKRRSTSAQSGHAAPLTLLRGELPLLGSQ